MIRRICLPGGSEKKGGRKRSIASTPELIPAFATVVDIYTAGDPIQDGVLWTNLTRAEIAAGLAGEGLPVSVTVVDHLLEEFGMGQRKPQKVKAMRHDPRRNAQFEWIAELKKDYLEAGLPVLSMDTKRREILGDYVRPGRVLSTSPLRGWDHDFPTHRQGVVIPQGLFDLARNEGYLHLGDSHDTSQFAADALLDWWRNYGCHRYPEATDLLLLCDTGGSNRAKGLLFKEQLQRVVDRTDLMIRVAHYPPGCSKYNPIEHRLFPHVTRKLQGLFLKSLEMFRDLARKATTSTGLRVFARIVRGTYDIGQRSVTQGLDQLRILLDPTLPDWNYALLPRYLWDVI